MVNKVNRFTQAAVLIALSLFLNVKLIGQCSNVAFVEAVRNGDFEAGYLKGSDTIHEFTPEGDFDFRTDLHFLGEYDSTAKCVYGIGNKYVVARGETFTCDWQEFESVPYWAADYLSGNAFSDHTPGKNGKGFCLIADMYSFARNYPGRTIAWEQKVKVFPNQTYYFSMWQAVYGIGVKPAMSVEVLPIINGSIDQSGVQTIVDSSEVDGIMKWKKFKGTWHPSKAYEEVYLRIRFKNLIGGSSGLDVALDDISFKNGVDVTSDELVAIKDLRNACQSGAEYKIEIKDTSGKSYPITSGSIHWYKGETYTQNEVSGFRNDSIVNFTEIGNYRYCVDFGNGEYYNNNVQITEGVSIHYDDFNLCGERSRVLKASSYDPSEVEGYQWTLSNGTQLVQDSLIVDLPNTIHVEALNKGNFSCNAKDTLTVTSSFFDVTDSIQYCPTENITYHTGNIDRVLTIDSAGQNILGFGESISFKGSQIPTGTKHLYLRAATVSNPETVPLLDLQSSSRSWSSSIKLTITKTVVLERAIVNTLEGPEGDYEIRFSGPTHGTKSVRLIPHATQIITLNQVLKPGEYTISSPDLYTMAVRGRGGSASSTSEFLNGAVVIKERVSQGYFLQDLVFRSMENICVGEKLPIARKEHCANTLELKDVNTNFNVCLDDEFEVNLVDLNGDEYDLSNSTVTWYGPESITTVNTDLKGDKVSFTKEGTYRFKVLNKVGSKVFNGLVDVNSSYNTNFNNFTLCASSDNLPLKVNPHSNKATVNWSDNSGTLSLTDSLKITKGGTYYVSVESAPNFSCNDNDTIVVESLLYFLKDTVHACNRDSIYVINTERDQVMFSEGSDGLKPLGKGPEYHYSPKSGISTIYVKSVETTEAATSFNNDQDGAMDRYHQTNSFKLTFAQDVYLTGYKYKVKPGSLNKVNWQLGSSNHYSDTIIGNDEIVEVKTNIFLKKGSHTFLSSDYLYSRPVIKTYPITTDYYLDNLISSNTSSYFFMKDMTFTKVVKACPSKSIYFETDPEHCIVTNDENVTNANVLVYPNPNIGAFTVKSTLPMNKILVYEQSGMLVKSLLLSNVNEYNIALNTSGVYYIQVSTDNSDSVEKIVVIK